MAKRYMDRQKPDHTLQTTALIHEAYLRLIDQKEARWQNCAHFFAVAAQAMRRSWLTTPEPVTQPSVEVKRLRSRLMKRRSYQDKGLGNWWRSMMR
jgi:hypothetical protein